MQALQTLSQREFEMMQCFWEADEPLKMKELQTRWAHGETPQSRSTTLIYPFSAENLVRRSRAGMNAT